MKQTIAVIILVLIILFGAVYFWLPVKNNIVIAQKLKVTPLVTQRMIGSKMYREKWLPKKGKILSENEFLLDDCLFTFASDMLFNNVISVKHKNKSASSFLILIPDGDGAYASLNFTSVDNNNFLEKFSNYFTNKHVKKTTQKLFLALQHFTDDITNVYGVKMKNSILKDSTLIAIKSFSTQYPSVVEIYAKVNLLKSYAAQNTAIQTNPPMLNIHKENDNAYNYMVALPINKWLENSGDIIGKRMLAGGNILESGEIKGGNKTIDYFLKELENFRADISAISPAIPYQSLITDRLNETDTAKWVTKLYFPVF